MQIEKSVSKNVVFTVTLNRQPHFGKKKKRGSSFNDQVPVDLTKEGARQELAEVPSTPSSVWLDCEHLPKGIPEAHSKFQNQSTIMICLIP